MAAEQGSTTVDKDAADLIVGVLGGTGDQGRGLAYRLGDAGNPAIIGSRSAGARPDSRSRARRRRDPRDGQCRRGA